MHLPPSAQNGIADQIANHVRLNSIVCGFLAMENN